MIIRNRCIKNLVAMGVAIMLIMPFIAFDSPALAAAATIKNIDPGSTWFVSENAKLSSLTISECATIKATGGNLLTMLVNGVETAIKPGTYNNVELVLTDKLNTSLVGTNNRGIDNYRAAIFVDKTGIVKAQSVSGAVSGGTVSAASASNISINSTSDNFNGIIVNGAEYTIKDSTFNFLSKSDGSDVCDFNGYGAVIGAYNDAKVTVDKVKIVTEGVARLAIFEHSYADVLLTDSSFKVMGGTLYDGYVNSADTSMMVAPPWVLGITGSARGTNLMGTCSSFTVVRTDANAANWGVISTDGGSDMLMTIVDSTLTLLGQKDLFSTNYGSGYGTYILGAKEYFYGVTFNVGTYAGIVTGGDATYASSKFDKPLSIYPMKQVPNGKTVTDPRSGQTREGYDVVTSDTPVFTGITGLGKNSVINSDAFGWMAHSKGNLTITDGTIVNTDNATFLMKAGDVNMTVSGGAKINSKDGVILQMIDNDDALVGLNTSTSIGLRFNTEFNEAKGYPGIDYAVKTTTDKRNTYTFTATDVQLNGDIYNGTGYFGGQAADLLEVTLGKGASLTGTISATSIIHIDEKGNQNTHFTMKEYYYLGHVANKMFYNGGNDISVTLKDGAAWTVTGTGTITGLTIGEGSTITAPKGSKVTMTVDGVKTKIQAGSYKGNIVLTVK